MTCAAEIAITKIMEHLSIKSLVIVIDPDQLTMMTSIVKQLSRHSQTVQLMLTNRADDLRQALKQAPVVWTSTSTDNLIRILNQEPLNTLDLRVASTFPMIVISNPSDIIQQLQLTIDQEVYILDPKSKQVHETYIVNGRRTERVLGQFDDNFERWTNAAQVFGDPFDLVAQRSNFHGVRLKIMTEHQDPYIMLQKGFEKSAKVSLEISNTFQVEIINWKRVACHTIFP